MQVNRGYTSRRKTGVLKSCDYFETGRGSSKRGRNSERGQASGCNGVREHCDTPTDTIGSKCAVTKVPGRGFSDTAVIVHLTVHRDLHENSCGRRADCSRNGATNKGSTCTRLHSASAPLNCRPLNLLFLFLAVHRDWIKYTV